VSAEPSAREWLRRLDTREVSARELATHYLERIEQVNPALNAIVALEPERTLAEAGRADELRAGGARRALLGLPVTVKDSIEAAGFTAAAGTFAREGFRPDRDATVVARVREAGGVLLGKSNVPEYISSFETDNMIYGRTNNPYDLERTPGGSSGGEAAILGADASPLGIGSDGGGSIRVPSHYCGIVGIRPTVGRVPETGAWPPSRATGSLDTHTLGPMGRYVEDVALLLEVIGGPDWIDPATAPVPLEDWLTVDPSTLTIGIYSSDPLTTSTVETREAVERAGAILERRGCRVVEATPPACVAEATELFFAAAGADGGARMRADVAAADGRHHSQFATLLAWGADEPPPSAGAYFATLSRVHAFRAALRGFVGGFDAVVCPVAAGPAPLHGLPPAGIPVEEYFRYEGFNYTHTYSLAGLPGAVVPVSASGEGLPIGVQIVAGAFREHVALAVAGVLEAELSPFETSRAPAADRAS
jgi:amidase